MSHNKANLFKIKEGKLNQWLAWCEQLYTTHRDEAVTTLDYEGVICEFFITFEIKDTHYTLGAEIHNQKETQRAPDNSEINLTHKQMKQECLDYIGPGSFSYLLNNPK